MIGALAAILVGSPEAEGWAPFVARELRDPGPAFEVLYERLWRPGVETVTQLIARARGISPTDEVARIQALMLISSLLAFQSGRGIALRTLQWSKIGEAELSMVVSAANDQIDAIARPTNPQKRANGER